MARKPDRRSGRVDEIFDLLPTDGRDDHALMLSCKISRRVLDFLEPCPVCGKKHLTHRLLPHPDCRSCSGPRWRALPDDQVDGEFTLADLLFLTDWQPNRGAEMALLVAAVDDLEVIEVSPHRAAAKSAAKKRESSRDLGVDHAVARDQFNAERALKGRPPLSNRELAAKLGVPESTLRRRLRAADRL